MMGILKFIRITINLQQVYAKYAKKLGEEVVWLKLMEAYHWFRRGNWLRRLWRHEVYRRLWPCRYEERRLQAEDAERHMKRAVIAAVYDQVGKAIPRRQNWRMN